MERDLTRVDLWEESQRRSRERRELAPPARRGIELPARRPGGFGLPARELSVAALVALAGVPLTAVAAAKVLGGGEKHDGLAGAAIAAVVTPVEEATVQPSDRNAAVLRAARSGRSGAATGSEPAAARPAVASRTASVTLAARPAGGVAELQRALGLSVDGDFGSRTERALKRWQRAHGLPADGVAGPRSRAKLGLGAGSVLKRARAARRHHARRVPGARVARRGGGVAALQRALGLGADGVFGPGTQRALKRWQRAHGLTVDGVAGPQTRSRLGLGAGPVLKRKGGGRRRGRSGGGGSTNSTVQRVVAAANRIATKPYKYGGGHGSFEDSGYDCSGSVSYALHGGGQLSSPLSSSGLMSYGLPGPGRHITIYANPGHAYMTIDGRRFDTTARSENGSRWSGNGRGTGGYVVRHPPGL